MKFPKIMNGRINASMTPREIYRVIDAEHKIGVIPATLDVDGGRLTWAEVRASLKLPLWSVGVSGITLLTMGPMALTVVIFGSLMIGALNVTRPMRDGYLLAPPVSEELDESVFDDIESPVVKEPEFIVEANQLADALSAYGISCDEYTAEGERKKGCDIYLETVDDGGSRIDVYEIKTRPGFKIGVIEKLGQDFARDLGLPGGAVVSVDSNIGNGRAALYVPKAKTHDVETMKCIQPIDAGSYEMPGLVGESSTGDSLVVDIAKGVHWKVCGTTGSGKSVQIMNMVLSAMYHMPPERLQVTAIDMKKTDLTMLDGFLHMEGNAITEPMPALEALQLIQVEMNRRLEVCQSAGVRTMLAYNAKHPDKAMPFKLLVIEELLLLIESKEPIYEDNEKGKSKKVSTVGKEVERLMVYFSVASRASGIHMIYGIQRPDSDSLNGQILSNTPSSIGMKTETRQGSEMIIGDGRCKSLLGNGDCYVKLSDGKIIRAQSAFATDDDIEMIGSAITQKWAKPVTVEAA